MTTGHPLRWLALTFTLCIVGVGAFLWSVTPAPAPERPSTAEELDSLTVGIICGMWLLLVVAFPSSDRRRS